MDSKLLEGLNEQQERAVTHGDGPLLIVAGAGTGKTTVISRRIAWLIETGKCKPHEILALTFTEKAASEMEERVDRLLPYGYVNLWVLTYHAFCERIVRAHALDIGLPPNLKLLDLTSSWLLVRKNLDSFDLDYYRPLGNPAKFIHAFLQHFSRAHDEEITPERYISHAKSLKLNTDTAEAEDLVDIDIEIKKIEELARGYHRYEQLLLENSAIDFGGLITCALRIFRSRPAILNAYRSQFKYILVDEFQDTNRAQYEIIKLLAGDRKNITILADDDQAIFRWRGASYQNIITFKEDYPESTELFLTQNYRSPQNILDHAYGFIQQNNPYRLEYELQEKYKQKGSSAILSKQLKSSHDTPGLVEHIHCASLQEEVGSVINRILEIRKTNQQSSWGDFAILIRSNDAAEPFVAYCASLEIPFQFLALKGLYAKPTTIDLLSYLRLLINPHESTAVYRVLTWPIWDLKPRTLFDLTHLATKKGISLWSALSQIEEIPDCDEKDRGTIRLLIAKVEELHLAAKQKRPSEIFLRVIKETGYLDPIKNGETRIHREALDILNQLYKKIQSFQNQESRATLWDFLMLVDLEQEAGDEGSLARDLEEGPDAIKILTIHSAKGLEFDYVFVVNMVDRRFPTQGRADSLPLPTALLSYTVSSEDTHLHEERRLFYVALTRARKGIFFTSAEEYGGARKKKISQFLRELGVISARCPVPSAKENTTIPIMSPTPDLPPAADPELPLPNHLSFSQLSAFRNCPLQYKFAFILRIPVFGKPSLSFGKTMHATAQKFFELLLESKLLPTLEELFAIYDREWVDDWYSSQRIKQEYLEQGRSMLKAWHEELSRRMPNPKAVERDFTIKIPIRGGFATLRGRIDRIDSTPSGGVELVDYKTGKSKATKGFTGDDKEQLLLYQIAAEEALGEKVEKLTYYYFEDGKSVSFVGTDKEKKELKEEFAEIVERIQQRDFGAKPGWHCKFCDFRDICEYRQ